MSLTTRVKIFCLFCFALALGVAAVNTGASASQPTLQAATPAQKIDAQVLADTANGQSASFVALLSDQADLSAAYAMTDSDARGWYVYNTLRTQAEQTQTGLRALLNARGAHYQSYWAANMLVVTGDRTLVDTLAARSDIKAIESNRPFRGIEDPAVLNATPSTAAAPDAPEWGVQNVHAPQVWALGFTGQGIVIANQDTGMQWDHPALKPHYRGWNGTVADHNYNWHDSIHASSGNPCGNNSPVPCDDHGHGTHTTGTTSGDDGAGNQIGVAPGAKWTGCRNMDAGNGQPSTYTECFQFFIAPTDLNGNSPNPALRPHVMNNSWGCPPSEGCAANTLQTIVENTQAAGIFVEASAGNSGSACSTVSDPPAPYDAAFSTAAYDSSNLLASFSSRGPVTVDGSNRRKPDIGGPGVSVRSSVPGNSYSAFSGTSMAGPHVVGVVALLWSAHPELARNITETKTILEMSANPNITVNSGQTTCGGIPYTTVPNNHFGYGRVDALAALNYANAQGTPTPTATTAASATPTTAPTHTATTAPSPTNTTAPSATAAATQTPGGPTATPAPPTATATAPAATHTPGATATPCAITFSDVNLTDYFYTPVQYLACHGVISGYADGTFRPYNQTTRSQMVKIVVLGFSIPSYTPPNTNTFADVPPSNPFFSVIEAAAHANVVSGYACGSVPSEPCDSANRPYFRPFANVTRGQLSKIVVVAAGWTQINPAVQSFQDVFPNTAFYTFVETAYCHGVISGYSCGGSGEPCGPSGKPYFRQFNDATRGQIAKIVYGALTSSQSCAATR